MKTTTKTLLVLAALTATVLYAANKYTPQAERSALLVLRAMWNGGGAPTSASVNVNFTRKLVHDDDPNDVIERENGSISFDALRADRSVQVGAGPVLTYRQVTLYYLSMAADMRANPDPVP